jgi:Na+/melibiose symporter-like transporter
MLLTSWQTTAKVLILVLQYFFKNCIGSALGYWQYFLQEVLVLVLPILFYSIVNNPAAGIKEQLTDTASSRSALVALPRADRQQAGGVGLPLSPRTGTQLPGHSTRL